MNHRLPEHRAGHIFHNAQEVGKSILTIELQGIRSKLIKYSSSISGSCEDIRKLITTLFSPFGLAACTSIVTRKRAGSIDYPTKICFALGWAGTAVCNSFWAVRKGLQQL